MLACLRSSALVRRATNPVLQVRWGATSFWPKKSRRPRENKYYTWSELLAGRQQLGINVKEATLPNDPYGAWPREMAVTKWPGIVAERLDGDYWNREQKHPVRAFYHNVEQNPDKDVLLVASTDVRLTSTRTIENTLHSQTRGYAVQIIFEGRGVKAYVEPKWPKLMVRLGVGAKVQDLSEICKRDPDVMGYAEPKKGALLVIHGPTKDRVGKVVLNILKSTHANVYTGKGGHAAFNPCRKKTPKKK